jgi:hypothetical protein
VDEGGYAPKRGKKLHNLQKYTRKKKKEELKRKQLEMQLRGH